MPTLILSFKKDDRSMAHVFFGPGKSAAEAAEDLVEIVRTYLK